MWRYLAMKTSKETGIAIILGLESMKQITEKIEDEIENVLNGRTDAVRSLMIIAHLNNVRKKVITDLCYCDFPVLPLLESFKNYLEENYKLLYSHYKPMLSNQL